MTLVLLLLATAMFAGGGLCLSVGVAFSTLAVGRDKDRHGGLDWLAGSWGAPILQTRADHKWIIRSIVLPLIGGGI